MSNQQNRCDCIVLVPCRTGWQLGVWMSCPRVTVLPSLSLTPQFLPKITDLMKLEIKINQPLSRAFAECAEGGLMDVLSVPSTGSATTSTV